MKTYILLGHDETTGAASTPVGFLAVDDGQFAVEFLPHEPAATVWRYQIQQLREKHQTYRPTPEQVEAHLDEANGITWGALVPDSAPNGSARTVVAALIDEQLAQTP